LASLCLVSIFDQTRIISALDDLRLEINKILLTRLNARMILFAEVYARYAEELILNSEFRSGEATASRASVGN